MSVGYYGIQGEGWLAADAYNTFINIYPDGEPGGYDERSAFEDMDNDMTSIRQFSNVLAENAQLEFNLSDDDTDELARAIQQHLTDWNDRAIRE